MGRFTGRRALPSQQHLHRPTPVKVGEYTIWAAAGYDLRDGDLDGMDILVPLAEVQMPFTFGRNYRVLSAKLEDFGGVPPQWKGFLGDQIIPELLDGKKLVAFCAAGHGRTGTLLASLIALLEDPAETPDPLAAARGRYCQDAVETVEQGDGIFALRGELLPEHYHGSLMAPSGDKFGFFRT